MLTTCRFHLVLLVFSLAIALPSAVAQVVIATVPVGILGHTPDYDLAVNSVTNKIYVANACGNDPNCAPSSPGTVTVIDGATNSTTTVTVGLSPFAVAVNSVTNKIYLVNQGGNTVTVIDGATLNTASVNVGFLANDVAVDSATNKIYVTNGCGNDVTCNSPGTVTVIDGATNNTTTVNAGFRPDAVAVNPVTNKIYVVNSCASYPCIGGPVETVTVIDGPTNNTLTVNVGYSPSDVAVDSVTNKIYVANTCGNDPNCNSPGTVTVIDGVTNNTTTVNAGFIAYHVAVNSVTNKIYVENNCGDTPLIHCHLGTFGTVTVIDGATDNTTTVNVGNAPYATAVDSVTNKIYVANGCGNDPNCQSDGTVTVIDGATNNPTSVAVGHGSIYLAVNATTNRIYVSNNWDNTVSVIAWGTPLQLVTVTPCRLADTRPRYGGGGPIQGGTFETFNLPQLAQSKGCANLSTAVAYSLNVAVVPHSGYLGYLTMWPTGEQQPLVSTLNSLDGRIKANAAILPAGYQGAINVYVTDTTDVILDIDGYFAPVSGSTLAFYPLSPPCRVADTRSSTFPPGLGTPHLTGGAERDFPVLSSTCGIPGTAQGYSLNLTAVPYPPGSRSPLGYLEVWPTGQRPPNPVSTLNNLTGTIVANAALVPAGTGGEITVYPSNDTDLVIDANGYFAPAGTGGLSLYGVQPCRVIDTRHVGSGQPFTGTLSPPVDVVDSPCAPPSTAQAYVFNTTVVPSGALGYLTLWPDGATQPVVSTLNALDGWITNNMAIVPSTNGKVDAYASGITQLILDISGYFAP